MTTKEKIEKIIEFEVKNNSVFKQIDIAEEMSLLRCGRKKHHQT